MSLKTVTFDADQWQIVPKVATDEMVIYAGYELHKSDPRISPEHCAILVRQVFKDSLATAPQPPELSPWLPIDEFILNTNKTIHCWIMYKGAPKMALFDTTLKKFISVGGSNTCYLSECISHVSPIKVPPIPQAPEVG